MANEERQLDRQDIGSLLWLKQQFERLHREHVLMMQKLDALAQGQNLLFLKLHEISHKLDLAPWLIASDFRVTFDEPVLK